MRENLMRQAVRAVIGTTFTLAAAFWGYYLLGGHSEALAVGSMFAGLGYAWRVLTPVCLD